MAEPRYVIVVGSTSAHCCFEASVIDMAVVHAGQHDTVCECFTMQDAKLVCAALNAQEAVHG